MADRPNVLLIMADQLTPFVLGAYGDSAALTPNIDSLAARGVRFDAAYCNSPLCTPSRMSMLTGRYLCHIGAWDNGSPLASDVPTIMHHFGAGGYRCVLSGKMHFIGPDQLHGYEERQTTDIYPASMKWTYLWEEQQRHGGRNSGAGPAEWPWSCEYDQRTQDRALEWLRLNAYKANRWTSRHKADDRPFFLTVSFTNPHPPFYTPKEYWDRLANRPIPMPPWPPRGIEDEHIVAKWIRDYHQLNELPSEDEVRRARRAYYGNVSFLDDKVGELMTWLERLGLTDNTIVALTSDHGEMLGEHGCWCKRLSYEWSSRVPLILFGPARLAAGRGVGEVTQLVDLLPTLLDLCGLPAAERIDGYSLIPLVEGRNEGWPGEAICENYTEGVKASSCMLRKGNLKYVEVVGHAPALYDLQADPGEFTNFAGRPEYAERQKALADRLAEIWDGKTIDRNLRENKKDRLLINKALHAGRHQPWDFDPGQHHGERWIR